MSDPLTNPVRDIIVPPATGGGGGGGTPAVDTQPGATGLYFSDRTDTQSYATKGTIFVADSAVTIYSATMRVRMAAGATYNITIAEYDGTAVGAVLGVSSTDSAPSLITRWLDVSFTEGIELSASGEYIVCVSRTDGTGTTSVDSVSASSGALRPVTYGIPLTVSSSSSSDEFVAFAQTAISPTDIPDATNIDLAHMHMFVYASP